VSDLQLRSVIADRGVDLEMRVGAGEVVAVVGPNGAGKSTALHVIAGLLRPDDGLVRLGTTVLTDTATGIFVPAHARRVGLLQQDALLFPHMSVLANVAFAPRSRRRGRREARQSAAHWLAQVDAAELADRRPHQLSGGQAQRVAIARALAAEPDVMLLDEPLAGLDVGAAGGIRTLLRAVLAGTGRSALIVTHDLGDVLTLADRVLVLDAGRIVDSGPTAAVLAAPRSSFVARLAGINVVFGTLDDGDVVRTHWGARWRGTPALGTPPQRGQRAVAVFTPAATTVNRAPREDNCHTTVAVTVAEVDTRGPGIRVHAEPQPDGAPGLAADLTADAAAQLRLTPGEQVYFSVRAGEITLHPA
jgi:molybdate transport system ATP-binding protein